MWFPHTDLEICQEKKKSKKWWFDTEWSRQSTTRKCDHFNLSPKRIHQWNFHLRSIGCLTVTVVRPWKCYSIIIIIVFLFCFCIFSLVSGPSFFIFLFCVIIWWQCSGKQILSLFPFPLPILLMHGLVPNSALNQKPREQPVENPALWLCYACYSRPWKHYCIYIMYIQPRKQTMMRIHVFISLIDECPSSNTEPYFILF